MRPTWPQSKSGAHVSLSLSLCAVAREVGIASSAIYRYVASRDDLLTLLIVDAFDSLGDAVDEALAGAPQARPADRFRTIVRAMREWALAHPHQYALIYGSPVPEYRAPAAVTTPAGTPVLGDPTFAESGVSAALRGVRSARCRHSR